MQKYCELANIPIFYLQYLYYVRKEQHNTMNYSELATSQWLILGLSALLVGLSKAGLKGLGMVLVVLMAQAFPAKSSTGLVLPLLIVADVLAVTYYRRDAKWSYLWRLLPAATLGVLLGVWIGERLDDETFGDILAWIVILGLLLLLWQEHRPPPEKLMKHPLVSGLAGLAGGFTTMVGNAGGPVMAVYLLATRLPKRQFIGTAAWFFMLINWFKVPFHIWSWHTITWSSLRLNLYVVPVIVLGFWIGIRIVALIPEKAFRYFVMIVTALTALRMLLY